MGNSERESTVHVAAGEKSEGKTAKDVRECRILSSIFYHSFVPLENSLTSLQEVYFFFIIGFFCLSHFLYFIIDKGWGGGADSPYDTVLKSAVPAQQVVVCGSNGKGKTYSRSSSRSQNTL